MQAARLTYYDLMNKAKQAEQEKDVNAAINNYKQAINLEPADTLAYNRLMIIYRKEKLYKEELHIIDMAVKNIQQAYNNRKSKPKANATISKLSKALMKSTGLVDKKGNNMYEPEPISSWKKRRQVVLKRLDKA